MIALHHIVGALVAACAAVALVVHMTDRRPKCWKCGMPTTVKGRPCPRCVTRIMAEVIRRREQGGAQ